jgi:hypothetical protein
LDLTKLVSIWTYIFKWWLRRVCDKYVPAVYKLVHA